MDAKRAKMTLDEAIKERQKVIEVQEKLYEEASTDESKEIIKSAINNDRQLVKWLTELKEAKWLVAQLKAKRCDYSEYCAYCDELDMSERVYFTCKYKKKKIPVVCHWQVLTPTHFDNILRAKNEV